MLNKMDVREDDEDYRNEIDEKFEKLGRDKPGHFAVRQYAKYRMAAGKTAKSILVSCGARRAPQLTSIDLSVLPAAILNLINCLTAK